MVCFRKKKSSSFAVQYLKEGPKVDTTADEDIPQYAVGEYNDTFEFYHMLICLNFLPSCSG